MLLILSWIAFAQDQTNDKLTQKSNVLDPVVISNINQEIGIGEYDSPSVEIESEDISKKIPERTVKLRPWSRKELGIPLYPGKLKIPLRFFQDVMISTSLEMFLENYYDFSIYQLPAMGGYGYPDNYVFSLLGNSWLWNRYSIHGHHINDSFFTGRSLHKLPMFSRDLEIDSIKGNVNFNNVHQGDQFHANINTGYLGPYIPYYKVFKDPYNLQTPQLREHPPTDSRRRNVFTLDLYKKNFYKLDDGRLWSDSYLTIRDRTINDFDEYGNASPYREIFFQGGFYGEWEKSDGTRPFGWLTTYVTRDHLFSEFYYHREETARLDDFTISGFYRKEDKLYHGHILNLNFKKITRHNDNFSRNLFDLTGEGLDPFFPSVEVYSISHHHYLGYNFDVLWNDFLKIETNLDHSINIVIPKTTHYRNPVYFKSPEDTLALYVTEWETKPFAYLLFDHDLTIDINQTDRGGFQVYGRLGIDTSGMVMNRESLIRIRPQFNLGMNILNGSVGSTHQHLRIEIGRVNIPFDSELALFVSDLYESGKSYVWNDTDNDLIVDAGEQSSQLHSTTGGRYRQIDPHLNQPHYYYIDIPYNINFNQNWSLGIAGHYRIFKDQLWVRLINQDTSGNTQVIDGQEVYVPSLGEKQYMVYNLPSSKFPDGAHWFNDSPFYAGASLKVSTIGNWYYFSISFAAYLVNGITTLGNGPLHNSQGTLSELMADPNADFRNLGRLDADRAYLGKLLAAFQITPDLTLMFDYKYRDGQPIGQWNYYVHGNEKQISFLRNSVSADNILLYNGEFGTREDAIMSMDVRLKYEFHFFEDPTDTLVVSLNIYNIVDFGRELVEFSFFKGETHRSSLELQVPRGLEITVRYQY